MPVEHIWYPDGLYTCYSGTITGKELLRSTLDVGGDARFDELRYAIADWSACVESQVSVEDVEKLSAYIRAMSKSNPRISDLIVMREDFHSQALVNLFMFLTDEIPWYVMGFRSLQDVDSWLLDNLDITRESVLED